jgi:hypothetical protein
MSGLPSSHTSARPLDSAGRVKRDYLTTALIQTYPAISGGPAKQRVCPASRVLALYRVDQPPEGSDWIHEVKHDGYRTMLANESQSSQSRCAISPGNNTYDMQS